MENEKSLKTKTAGGVVINSRGKILVVNQKETSWSLPKSHLELDETELKAAKREIVFYEHNE